MVYDLGLHLDCKAAESNPEDVEVRRRVFWGAYICDKLQSLYLGRPFLLHDREAHVPKVSSSDSLCALPLTVYE